jgi:hypothetical protein
VELLTITVLEVIALVVDIGGIVNNYCFSVLLHNQSIIESIKGIIT